jgi:hypothetical protein
MLGVFQWTRDVGSGGRFFRWSGCQENRIVQRAFPLSKGVPVGRGGLVGYFEKQYISNFNSIGG